MSQRDITLSPVGFVRANSEGWVLEIEPLYRPGLTELSGFSHIQVLWWSHLLESISGLSALVVDRPYQQAPEKVGVFATRSPLRPNSLCLSVAPVVHVDVEAGKVYLGYIDAEDGTPILDIKPYQPCSDRVRDVVVPGWCAGWPQWYEESASFDWQSVFENAR